MDVDAAYAELVLEDLSEQRARARLRRWGDPFTAALIGLICLAGSVVFAIETQITTMSCEGSPVTACQTGTTEYDGWAFWAIAAAAATAVVLLSRHLRGVRRATTRRWAGRFLAFVVVLPVAVLFAGYSWGTLGTEMPFVFPAAAAIVLAAVAVRRGDADVAIPSAVLAAAIVIIGMRMRTSSSVEWWFNHNLGYILVSVAVGAAATWATVRWHRIERT